jgi:homoserine O-acetyltransferase
MADLDWNNGEYYGNKPPGTGLKLARMVGHITYMSDDSMREKFGRRTRVKETSPGGAQFEVESYLDYQGYKFVDRFDANSYIYITRAMDTFDLTTRGSLSSLFEGARARFLVISFTSDWLYPSYQSLEIASALRGRNCDVAYCDLEARFGHDSFLVEVESQREVVAGFLASTYRDVQRASSKDGAKGKALAGA